MVLDTSVLVDHLRACAPATEYLAGLEGRPACSEISRIEVVQGLRSRERAAAKRLFALIEWVPVSEAIARRAGELGRQWRHSHPGIGVADLAIAATAEQLDAALATRNLKHFPMFEGLRSPY
ncbi:MAG TPA: type II toxin-antitoxin system VapC family toxin [Solirubrobacterales bacterium]|nr:type II toxin-antitoxin system VapC family toxin [Solirubrobacterales bacterium]